ncbi:kinase subdomain-containing protein, partial [Aureobasidium melanogenum]
MTEKSSAAGEHAPVNAGAQDLAINNTGFNRFFTRVALKTLARFHKSDGFCRPISRKLIIKTGPWVDLTEAATMRFIAEKTSIPVPKVHCSFVHKGRTYILMERIQGEEIPRAWARLGDHGRTEIFAQLKQMIDEMRSLTPPSSTRVQSCTGGDLWDSRYNHCHSRFGPFATIQEFHLWLRQGCRVAEHKNNERMRGGEGQEIARLEAMHDGPWPPPVFTHGDLNPGNILVRDQDVVAIIDWEFAGWYPHYWEYTAAWYGNLVRTGWQDVLPHFLQAYPAELAMEINRQR